MFEKQLSSFSTKKKEFLLRISTLALIYVLAFFVRLFSVLRFESVIHEFDPYFNFRSAKYLVEKGWYAFNNWFDERSWYPLGRIVGGSVYPGIQITAAFMYWILRSLNITVALRNVCVLTSPFFASNTAISTYLLTKEIGGEGAGLLASAMIAIVPGYISRSVAGSFDNEGVAIFALITTFYLFIKSVKTGSLFWVTITGISYYYMVNAWGGYVFIINLIPLYVLALVLTGNYSNRLYVAYSSFYVLGTLLSMQVRFVGFQAVQTGEHMGALLVFLGIQVVSFVNWVKSNLPKELFNRLLKLIAAFFIICGIGAFFVGTATGYISPWTGRFYSMLDPTYAKKYIPIIASVSEHQPTTWSSYFFDLHILTILLPVGLYFCFKKPDEGKIFLILYGIFSVYFAGVMVRLMLVLAPAACMLSAIGVSELLKQYIKVFNEKKKKNDNKNIENNNNENNENINKNQKKNKKNIKIRKKKIKSKNVDKNNDDLNSGKITKEIAMVMIIAIFLIFFFYIFHCIWVTSEAYSSPSIVLAARGRGGQRIIFDDFREAYYWLSQNTPDDAKVMSWWDYGYQITAMANRTIIVDNNTWNNTHIATVGKAMASNETVAYKIIKLLDVDYVLVIFGGITGYQSDDINKFLWMVRIAGSVDKGVKERDYLSNRGEYRVDKHGSKTMLDSLMYKLSYYRFGEMQTEMNRPKGWDRVRGYEIGRKDFQLNTLEEAFTSEHYIVRIFKVKHEF